MTKGIRLGKIFGIEIRIDPSWFLVSILFAWTFGGIFSAIPELELSEAAYFALGAMAALLLFACLIGHELGHAVTAQRKGIEVRSITLFMFGGVAAIKSEPKTPRDEFQIAVAGPIVSILLGVLFLGIWWVSRSFSAAAAIFFLVGQANVALAVFNLLPGFPLDGGRILRAAVWKATNSLVRATKIASFGGQVIGWGLIAGGVAMFVLVGDFIGGIWLTLIGIFLLQAAVTGYRQLMLKRSLWGMTVEDLMTEDVVTIPGNKRIDEAINDYFLRHRHTAFPVLGYMSEPEGIISLNRIKELSRERWPETTVRQLMVPIGQEIVAKAEEDLSVVVERLGANPVGRFLVMDGDGLRGILSSADIVRHFEIRSAFGEEARSDAPV